ncbi:hypothetical protein ACJMK2_004104 [Sinanodonta woodiana]|uniref:NACHT domain-containing protein n=1 Tax=Sinanodonta woodiana TaxID=1069815 RepID=A0ABD3Y073_SINWO
MPPTGANTKVKDPEYCNWLKVGLALYYLKDGLSSFIQDEVDAMHQSLLQKLYKASTVPAQLCSSCNAKNVKQNRKTYVWEFKSSCSISLCDTWLTELLALCTNPTSSKLFCENCDVTAWPKSPWECAKFYMPRGQTVHNTGPVQSDSQALLTLMANCKHFHSKLSPGGIQLTHTVSTIRNTVMHSGDMRLSDSERTSFITDIIKLLEDPSHLISLDECKKAVLEINKLLLIKAYKGVQIISVNAVLDNALYWKDLEDFYTDIVIEEEKEEEVNESTKMIKNKQQLEKAVTSFRQIFEKCDRKVTRIILQAPAGQGKSTFCRKLVHTWCSVKKKQLNIPIDDETSDRSETSGLKHEDELLRFDVLLYICLRDISDEKTLMDVVYSQFPLDESQSHISHIEALIGQAENNKVLLIMDGLDEIGNSLSYIGKILRRELYPNLTVLATTRSWKVGELRLIRSAHFDLLLDLQGFSFDNSMLFAKKMFDNYYKDESAMAQFKKDIIQNDVIRSLIHVPLLLLFIVQVWYDRKSFPQTFYELYLEMLDVIVNRYMAVKERIGKNQERQDQKIQILPNERPKGNTTFNSYPKLSKLSVLKNFGGDFLAALCEVANHFLIKACGETTLVFEEEVLLELLGKEGTSVMQNALDLGILSKSESRGTFRKKICLTFLHKTVQEFLAAINICCREDRCNMFLDSLKTFEDVLWNEQIIKFAAGISTTHCQKIFEKIYEVCDKDRPKEFRLPSLNKVCYDNDVLKERRMNVLSRLCIDCIREAHKETLSLKLYCFYADDQKIWNELQSALKNTLKVRIHLKYLHLRSCVLNDAEFDFIEFQCLTMIHLNYMTVSRKQLISKCTHLKFLKLSNCTLDGDVLDSMSESIFLEELIFEGVTLKGKLLISKCTHLKCLKLSNCTLDGDVLDSMSESICLEELIFEDVTLKGKLSISKCTHLKCLTVNNCTLDVVLDLSESIYQELICIEDFGLTKVTRRGELLLSKCTDLRILNLMYCTLDDDVLDLSEFTCLEELSLEDVITMGKLLLSKCTHLKCLNVNNCALCDDIFDLSDSTCLEYIRLKDVTIDGKLMLPNCTHLKCLYLNNCILDDVVLDLSESICLESLIINNVTNNGKLSLSKCTHLKCLDMNNCIIGDYALDLSESICLEYISIDNVTMTGKLLLSKCTHLKYLKLASCTLELTVFDLLECTCLESFVCDRVTLTGRGVLKCTLLKELMLVNCNLGEFTLYISGFSIRQLQKTSMANTEQNDVNRYIKITLDSIAMSKECKEVFYNSLSQCNEIQRLSIKNVDLCYALLSFDSDNYILQYVDFSSVSMSKECTEVFCKSFSKFKYLKILSIKNFDLYDARLSFEHVNYVSELSFDNVTMSNECTEVFCNSLSQCKELERLSIKNVHLCDARLSFVSVKFVDLDNVTMSKECTVVFCNSLSQCKELERLSIKNVHLCDALLSLVSVKHLNLDNVTMSKECTVVFWNSLSQCKELERLSIKNVHLCDVQLCFVSVKHLNLDNVTMSKECTVVFCNSLSQCKELERLSIKNVHLCDALLCLDSVKYIWVDNVTMSKECKEMFFNSLSQFRNLKKLSIKNVDLCDALLSLVSVKHLNLDNVTMSKQCMEVFCKSLSQCRELNKLSIKNVDLCDALLSFYWGHCFCELTLDNVTMSNECKKVFCQSLSWCEKLERLSIKNVDLCDALLRLNNEFSLYELNLDNVTMSKQCMDVFCDSLSWCESFERLSIKNMDLCDAQLSLDSKNDFCEINLDNVTMSKECMEVFCDSLSQCWKLERLSIKNVDLCDALLRLDSMYDYCEVNIDNVTMSKECTEVFCTSLSQCGKLERLLIKNVDLCDAVLKLDNEFSLYELNLDNLTMSKECKEVFCKSLSHCKKLETLSIKNVDLCDALLILVSVKFVDLDNVTMSKECKELFCKSLSQCKELERLSIKNVELCDGLHELYNMKRLNYIALEGVEMGTLGKGLMCKSLCQYTQLMGLTLKNLDLGDELLSLNNLGMLSSLTIDNVTMCKDGYLMLCSSISMCKELSLKNLDLGDVLLNLNNLGMLRSLNVDNVTMCRDGYLMMCSSISMCKQLSLKNLDLGDGLLNLNNLGMLSSLTIDNITMCKDGYLMLCSSISTCKHLKLSLKNLDLGDAIPSLDNLKEFELVNVTMSIECVDYIKSSKQHQLSSYFKTALNIEMIANSCDKCVVNYTNKRDQDLDEDDATYEEEWMYDLDEDYVLCSGSFSV